MHRRAISTIWQHGRGLTACTIRRSSRRFGRSATRRQSPNCSIVFFVCSTSSGATHWRSRSKAQRLPYPISGKPPLDLDWIKPGLNAAVSRADLVRHTSKLAERIAARIKICLEQARLSAGDIEAVFLTGGSVQLAHVRNAIMKTVPEAQIVEGDTFGAVGKGLTIEAAQRVWLITTSREPAVSRAAPCFIASSVVSTVPVDTQADRRILFGTGEPVSV